MSDMFDRFLDSFRAIVRETFPRMFYLGTYEYKVNSGASNLYELAPTDPVAGLPPISSCPIKPGVAGATSTLAVGSLVYVTFINSDPARPCIVGLAGPGDAGFTPTTIAVDASGQITLGHASSVVNLGGGYSPVLRSGETISLVATGVAVGACTIKGVITYDPTIEVAPGPPPTGFSTVKA